MKELTRAEELIMQTLWELKKGFLKDISENHPDPKPAYTTVSTVVNVLIKKDFIGFNTYGKTREYFPLVSKSQYSSFSISGLVRRFFDGSPRQFASFFTQDNDLSKEELESIRELIDEEIARKR